MTNLFIALFTNEWPRVSFELLYCSSNKSEVGSISGTMDGACMFPNVSKNKPLPDSYTLPWFPERQCRMNPVEELYIPRYLLLIAAMWYAIQLAKKIWIELSKMLLAAMWTTHQKDLDNNISFVLASSPAEVITKTQENELRSSAWPSDQKK